ncbi:MAG: tetratricopeptide repeat protein [Sphingomonas sp.]
MALTPQNEETFFREVDDELRRDQLNSFWRRYGRLVAIGVAAALLALAGYLWWQHDREKRAGVDGEVLSGALRDVAENRPDAAKPALAKLADSDFAGYRATARLTSAALALDEGDEKAAVTQYGAIAADASLPEPFRNLALIRQTATDFDTLPPQTVVDRLKPLAVAGNPWFGSAGELVALAYQKMGKADLAGPLFVAMAKDKTVPETIRARAVRLAGALGQDTTALTAGPTAAGGGE